MNGKALIRLLSGLPLMILFTSVAAPAATETIPGIYPSIQAAVTAVQGTPDATVIINSDATFEESLTITQSVIIEAGPGYDPIIRGAVADTRTVYFNPNSATVQSFTLRGVTLLPEDSTAAGNNTILGILNEGTAVTDVLIDGVTINDPDNLGPTGISIRSSIGPSGAFANNVEIVNSAITLGGVPSMGVSAIVMLELGSLTVSGADINMSLASSDAFDSRLTTLKMI